jgi:hypothetical protein
MWLRELMPQAKPPSDLQAIIGQNSNLAAKVRTAEIEI